MADFVPVENVAEFAVVQDMFGENVINVFHIKKEGGWTSATLAEMAVVLISAYNDDFAPLMSSNNQFVLVRSRDLTTQNGAVDTTNFPPNSGGDIGVNAMPGQNAISASHTTGVAGRSFRGRSSMAGITVNQVAGNLIPQSLADAWVAAFDSMDARINTAGGTWGVVSKYSGYTQSPPKYKKVPTPRAAGIFTDINNTSVSRRVGSMDSRSFGAGQ